MTRAEKLEAVETKFQPILETRKQNVEDARLNLKTKEVNYEEKLLEYKTKVSEVNTYYDAQDKIAELMALTEPTV